jgi:hypothetical protein
MSELYLPAKLENLLPEQHQNNSSVVEIKDTIRNCSSDISQVSKISSHIKAEGGWDSYWHEGKNIKKLADNLVVMSLVQQNTLNIFVLLMGAACKMKSDYNTILESIDDLSKSHAGRVDVLEYLVKIKNTVNEIKRRDELLDSLITYSNDLRRSIEELNNHFNKKIESILKSSEELAQELNATKLSIEKKQKDDKIIFNELREELNQKYESALKAINDSENTLQSRLESNSESQLNNISALKENLNNQVAELINSQIKANNKELYSKIKKNTFVFTGLIIALALAVLAIIVLK